MLSINIRGCRTNSKLYSSASVLWFTRELVPCERRCKNRLNWSTVSEVVQSHLKRVLFLAFRHTNIYGVLQIQDIDTFETRFDENGRPNCHKRNLNQSLPIATNETQSLFNQSCSQRFYRRVKVDLLYKENSTIFTVRTYLG